MSFEETFGPSSKLESGTIFLHFLLLCQMQSIKLVQSERAKTDKLQMLASVNFVNLDSFSLSKYVIVTIFKV